MPSVALYYSRCWTSRTEHGLRRVCYCPHMAADVMATVWNGRPCAWNRVKLRKYLHRLNRVPAARLLQFVAIDTLGPLPRTRRTEKRFIIVITDQFSKLMQTAALSTIATKLIAIAFGGTWVFK